MQASLKMLLGALVIGTLMTSTADAGLRLPWPVTIDPINRTANGSAAAARSGVGGQYIGCWLAITGTDDQVDATYHGGCWAMNAVGVAVSCQFPNTLVNASVWPSIYAMSRDALLSFSWDANNNCTQLQTWVYSNIQPKLH